MTTTSNNINPVVTDANGKRKIKYTSDWTLWACYIILCAVSVIEVFSASSLELKAGSVYLPIASHVRFLLIGLVCMLVLERIHYKYFKLLMVAVFPLSILLAILVSLFGVSEGDAQRAIKVGGVSLQAAEPCKFAVALVLAYFLARYQKKSGKGLTTKGIVIGFAIMALYVVLLIKQGGSNALLIIMLSCLMMLIAGLPRWLVTVGVACVMAGVGAVAWLHFTKFDEPAPVATEQVAQASGNQQITERDDLLKRLPLWKDRIDAWLGDSIPEYEKPTVYSVGGNSQRHFANMAISHGAGVGVGPGNSRECSRLQLAFSDFIYAFILEELGILGGFIVLLCYLGIVVRAGMIGMKCKNAYSTLLIMGMALMISIQAFYHMAISVGLLPVSGQTLPFISKGGTSIVIMSMAMGVMLSVSRFAVERTPQGLKTIDDADELPHDLRASNPTGVM